MAPRKRPVRNAPKSGGSVSGESAEAEDVPMADIQAEQILAASSKQSSRAGSVLSNKSVPQKRNGEELTNFLGHLQQNPDFRLAGPELAAWIVDTASTKRLLEDYAGFWDVSPATARLDTAEDLCEILEKFLLSFIADPAAWKKDQLETTASRMTAVLKLFRPIVAVYSRPPQAIFRRLDGLQRNMFRIQPYAAQSNAVTVLLDSVVDLCELWFFQMRSDSYKLMANCVVYLLAKSKLTAATLKRLNSWSDFFLLFRAPVVMKEAPEVSIRHLYLDLELEEWEDEEDRRENSEQKDDRRALLEVEKIDYLADALLQLFSRSEAISSPEGKRFLTLLLTINPDFMNIGRIAIDDLMSSHLQTVPKHLEAVSEIVLKAWADLQKKHHPLRFDLESLIITDLMQRSIRTDKNHRGKYLSKYCLMVSHMYNNREAAVQRMFHANYDLLVLDAVKSENVTLRTNALRMLGKCFPLIGPEIAKSQQPLLISQRVDLLLLNMKHACPGFRAAAASAAGDALNRAWALVAIPERAELLKQLSSRLVCDDASVPVRTAAVKAITRILSQPLCRTSMVPILTALKTMATDEVIAVRLEYYTCVLAAVQLGLHTAEGGETILDTEQMLSHFVERDRPYGLTIEQILDLMLWNIENPGVFLRNSVHLLLEQPAVAVKCFQTIPKTKKPEEIHAVLDCIFGQIYLALSNNESRRPDLPNAPLSMTKPERVNVAIELGGIIWAATVLVLAQKPELSREIQEKAVAVLKRAKGYTDVLSAINLYRLACRLPVKEIPEYQEWCLQELRNMTTATTEQGITLMTFVHAWGASSKLVDMAKEWLAAETKPKAQKRKRGEDAAVPEKQAHLGLLYISMLMSDPDISGTFNDLDEELLDLAEKSVAAFLKYLPDRFSGKSRSDGHLDDRFYVNLLVFLAVFYIHRIHYKRDPGVIRDQFHKILLKVKEHVFERLGLGMPNNVLFAIKSYKDNTKERLKRGEAYVGEHETIILAKQIVENLQDILHQLVELSKMEDEDLQIQLLGCTQATKKIPLVTLVTPSETPKASPSKGRGRRKN